MGKQYLLSERKAFPLASRTFTGCLSLSFSFFPPDPLCLDSWHGVGTGFHEQFSAFGGSVILQSCSDGAAWMASAQHRMRGPGSAISLNCKPCPLHMTSLFLKLQLQGERARGPPWGPSTSPGTRPERCLPRTLPAQHPLPRSFDVGVLRDTRLAPSPLLVTTSPCAAAQPRPASSRAPDTSHPQPELTGRCQAPLISGLCPLPPSLEPLARTADPDQDFGHVPSPRLCTEQQWTHACSNE